MYKTEIFTNYALRNLLPIELRELIKGSIEGSKENTILVAFSEEEKRDKLIGLCKRYRFEYQMILEK